MSRQCRLPVDHRSSRRTRAAQVHSGSVAAVAPSQRHRISVTGAATQQHLSRCRAAVTLPPAAARHPNRPALPRAGRDGYTAGPGAGSQATHSCGGPSHPNPRAIAASLHGLKPASAITRRPSLIIRQGDAMGCRLTITVPIHATSRRSLMLTIPSVCFYSLFTCHISYSTRRSSISP